MYTVTPAVASDAAELSALENEFIDDHKAMLSPMLPDAQEEELCQEVGLDPRRENRVAIIKATTNVLPSHRGRATLRGQGCTLKCMYHPPRGKDLFPQAVGYLYFKLKKDAATKDSDTSDTDEAAKSEKCEDNPPLLLVFSHLKVGRLHQGRGCTI